MIFNHCMRSMQCMCKRDEKSWNNCTVSAVDLHVCTRTVDTVGVACMMQLLYTEPLGLVDSHHMLQNVLYFLNFISQKWLHHTHTQPNRCMEAHRSLSKPCMPMPAPIMVCIDRQGQTVCSDCHHWTPNHTWPFMWVDNQHSNTWTRSNYNHHSHAVGCGAGSRSSITQLQLAWSCSGWGPSTDGKTSGLSLSCFRVLCVAFAVRADR